MSELYTLPDGWEWSNFKDSLYLTDFVANGSFASLKENVNYLDKKDYAILVRLKDFSSKWNGDYIYVDKHSYDFLSKSSLNENDIMMCNVGSVGLHFRVPNLGQPMTIGPNSILIRPSVNYLDNSFLYYYFSSNIFKDFLETIIAKTAQPKFNKTGFKTLSIPLPSLEEQKRIVAKLDNLFAKIDKAIALHQKNIDEADIFMESVLNDIFVELNGVYQKRQLDSFDKKMSSGGTPSRKEKLYWDNGTIDWFSSGELNQLYTLPSKEKITQLGLEKTSTKLFSKGTLLIGMYDTAAMKMSILSNDGSCNQAIVGFKSDESELNILFLKYQLEYLKKDILEQRQGVRQQNLNLSKIKNIEIEYPPLKTQQKVVSYLDEISNKMEKIKNLQKEKMQSLKELKASILDKAFKGEL